ncbi:MAG: sigma 54-interacting transcriptional regulator, partial [Vicinamibacterales bacterium]
MSATAPSAAPQQLLVGMSAAARTLVRQIDCAAASDAKVLITGESGSGKEIAARLIHARGARRRGSFVSVNCVGLPESLLEGELFGHVRGSFTGAFRDRDGLLRVAHGGTALLDEVSEMSLRMQALLLRFLETGEIQPVGGLTTPVLDVRVVATTHRSLKRMVEQGAFREDLFYRLNVVEISVPALRERIEDVPLLARHFIDHICGEYQLPQPVVSPEAFEALKDYRWPGNIRELRNTIERTIVCHRGGILRAFELPKARTPLKARSAPLPPVAESLFDRIARKGESFWHVAYEPFIRRDLTREQMRELVVLGLEATCGSYKLVADLFGIAPIDY